MITPAFQLIAITPETELPRENILFEQLFDAGLERLHLRRPEGTEEEMRRLIDSLSPRWYPRLVLHDHPSLAVEYRLGGVHLNRRNPVSPPGFAGTVSRSCHSFDEVAGCHEDYCFLSPIFNSVSKVGYMAAFGDEELTGAYRRGIIHSRVVALGGITAGNLSRVIGWGFGGAALLGWLWADDALANYCTLRRMTENRR